MVDDPAVERQAFLREQVLVAFLGGSRRLWSAPRRGPDLALVAGAAVTLAVCLAVALSVAVLHSS